MVRPKKAQPKTVQQTKARPRTRGEVLMKEQRTIEEERRKERRMTGQEGQPMKALELLKGRVRDEGM
jgi:hypothetical protein